MERNQSELKRDMKAEGYDSKFDLESISYLGTGARSLVYEIRDSNGNPLAIKVSFDEEGAKRLIEESNVLGKLAGLENVLQSKSPEIYKLNTDVFLLLELGESLKSLIGRGETDEETFLKIIEDVSNGLSNCHKKGVFHRDLKASNIFRVEDHYKIGDFTEAGSIDEVTSGELRFKGTFQSRPLEVLEKKEDGKSISAEIYSLGHLMHHILVGKQVHEKVYKDTKDVAIAQRTIIKKKKNGTEQQEVEANLREKGIPDYIVKVVLECLAKKEERYQTIAELGEALDKTYIEARQGAETLYNTAIDKLTEVDKIPRDQYGVVKHPDRLEAALTAVEEFQNYAAKEELKDKGNTNKMADDIGSRIEKIKDEQEKGIAKVFYIDPNKAPLEEPDEETLDLAKKHMFKVLDEGMIKPEDLEGIKQRYSKIAALLDI